MALRTVQNAEITLEGVRVPEEKRLQKADSFKDTAAVLRATRAGVAWHAVGLCPRRLREHGALRAAARAVRAGHRRVPAVLIGPAGTIEQLHTRKPVVSWTQEKE
jgi:alkylation response protein AidB-like acyl-CoA dehydrogenase